MDCPLQPSNEPASKDLGALSFGLVAWLDVLGFKTLLSANEDKAHVWVEVLGFLKSSHEIQEMHSPTPFQQESIGLSHDDYKVTAFADTVVSSVDISRAGKDKTKQWHWITNFLMKNAYLCRQMFDYGLPVRGGISMGKFYHSSLGFAGKPFVTAESLSSCLDLSACVFSDECINHVKSIIGNSNFLWFGHQCQIKAEPFVRDFYVLDYFSRGVVKATKDANDIKNDFSSADLNQVVLNSFMAHGKQIEDESVRNKITNTVSMLEKRKASGGLFS